MAIGKEQSVFQGYYMVSVMSATEKGVLLQAAVRGEGETNG